MATGKACKVAMSRGWCPYGAGTWQGFFYAVFVGAAAGGIATGTWQGAMYGAFSAGLFYGVGSYFQNANWAQATSTNQAFGSDLTWGGYGAKVLAHGIAGGVMNVLYGGKFGNGFAAAGFSEAVSPGVGHITDSHFAQGFVASIVGGTASELTGGKFANGALTAAFSYAFNDALHGLTEDNEIGRLVHDQIYANERTASPFSVTRGRVGDMGWGDGYTDLVVETHIFEIKPISYMRSGYLYTSAFDQVQGYVEAAGGAYMRGNPAMLRGPTTFRIMTSDIFRNRVYQIQLYTDPHNANSGLIFYSKTLVTEQLRSFWRMPSSVPSSQPIGLPSPIRLPVGVP